jgi:hypothetical protein
MIIQPQIVSDAHVKTYEWAGGPKIAAQIGTIPMNGWLVDIMNLSRAHKHP